MLNSLPSPIDRRGRCGSKVSPGPPKGVGDPRGNWHMAAFFLSCYYAAGHLDYDLAMAL